MTSDVRPGERAAQRLLHRDLRLGVEVGGRLVEHDDVGRLQEQAGDGDALLLAAGEPVAAVADDGVEAVGERFDERQDVRGAQRLEELGVGGVGLGVAQVRAQRLVEEVRVLGDDADRGGSTRSVASRTSMPLMRTAPERTS